MEIRKSASYEEKHSKFYAFCVPVHSESETRALLSELKKAYPKARHIVRAARYANAYGVYVTEASEDQEPISAMKKTAAFLEKEKRENVAVFIVRIYGGSPLGASHLDHVYLSLALSVLS
jgi:putative IMPACT (imprinted ancient) family translation regulator